MFSLHKVYKILHHRERRPHRDPHEISMKNGTNGEMGHWLGFKDFSPQRKWDAVSWFSCGFPIQRVRVKGNVLVLRICCCCCCFIRECSFSWEQKPGCKWFPAGLGSDTTTGPTHLGILENREGGALEVCSWGSQLCGVLTLGHQVTPFSPVGPSFHAESSDEALVFIHLQAVIMCSLKFTINWILKLT